MNARLNSIQYLQAELGTGNLPQNEFDRAVLVSVIGEIHNQEAATRDIYGALKHSGVLSITEVIFDPHFQSLKSIQRLTEGIIFRGKVFPGKRLAYALHVKKPANG